MEVPTAAEALAGARDIIAERVTDDAPLRGRVRKIYEEEATVSSKIMYGKEEEADAQKFRDYFEWSEPLKSIPSHRMLAIRRGEKEGFLLMRVEVPLDRVTATRPARLGEIHRPGRQTGRPGRRGRLQAPAHAVDGNRGPPVGEKTRRRNRHQRLRRQPPRTPARLAARREAPARHRPRLPHRLQDRRARPLRQTAPPHRDLLHRRLATTKLYEAAVEVTTLVKKYDIEAIAIGNGTASRETEAFVKKLKLPSSIPVVMVNESGASIYSASDVAREEFPNEDVTVRGAVSIGRRLMDPLAELVKIDPKVHRRRPIPARCRSARAQGQPRRHRRSAA